MIAIICAALTALGFYFSVGLGEQWWLAWLAPTPILWLAFGNTKGWKVLLLAWGACALGATNIIRAYGGILPAFVLALGIAGPALLFAIAVMVARRAYLAFGPVVGMLAFAASWAALDFLQSFDSAGGAIATPAGAEVGAPILMQSAALVGFTGITFILGAFSAGIAASLAARRKPRLLSRRNSGPSPEGVLRRDRNRHSSQRTDRVCHRGCNQRMHNPCSNYVSASRGLPPLSHP